MNRPRLHLDWSQTHVLIVWLAVGIFLSGGPVRITFAEEEEDYYQLITLPVPSGLVLEVSGVADLGDGRIAVSTRRGDIWIVENAFETDLSLLKYTRFATALHEPLGLIWHQGAFYVAQRSELTRIRDLDGDGKADEYIALAKGWSVSGNYHEYAFGPKLDPDGNFWVTLNARFGRSDAAVNTWRGWGVKISPRGKLVPICAGMRTPAGVGANAAGDMFFTDQQGNWVGGNKLGLLEEGTFHGHVQSLDSTSLPESPLAHPGTVPQGKTVVEAARLMPTFRLPAVWFPYEKVGRSMTDIVCDQTGGRFGPFSGQLFIGEFVQSGIVRVYLEKVRGVYQGACFRFRGGFQCGVLRLGWGRDGSLFAGETNRGWNSRGPRSYGLERLVWTGQTPFEVRTMEARRQGFRLTFTQPVETVSAERPESYSMRSYTYLYQERYGSAEVDVEEPTVTGARVHSDGRTVDLDVSGLRAGYVHELLLTGVRSRDLRPLLHPEAYYTLNRIP